MFIIRAFPLAMIAILPSAADAQSNTFCQRLAPQLNMKPIKPAPKTSNQSQPEWKINLLGGLGPVLFGGSAVASFQIKPTVDGTIDDAAIEEYDRLEDACKITSKGVICDIEGPAQLIIGTKNGDVVADAIAGELATVEMRKTTIYCRQKS